MKCLVVAACGYDAGHRGDHGAWHTFEAEKTGLRGDVIGAHLTERDMEIIEMYARVGYLPEVAERVHLSLMTVKNHMTQIYARLGVHSWQEAMYVLGWIRIPTDEQFEMIGFERRFEDVRTDVEELARQARQLADELEATI